MIWDDKNDDGRREAGEDGVGGLRVFLDDNRDGERDAGEPSSHTTNVDAASTSCPIPTRYQVAGGELPPLVLERSGGRRLHGAARLRGAPACARAPARSIDRRPRRRAAGRDLHPRLRRLADRLPGQARCGSTSPARPGPDETCASARDGHGPARGRRRHDVLARTPGVDGLRAATSPARDIYGGASRALRGHRVARAATTTTCGTGARHPRTAVAGLDALVEQAAAAASTASSSVASLVGHSMGGLVMRHYIDDAGARRQGPADRHRRHAVLGLAEDDLPARRRRRGADVLGRWTCCSTTTG